MHQRMQSWLFVIILLLLTNGCTFAKREKIKSSYQQALESYYVAIEDSINPEASETALNQVNSILNENPSDLESRALRASIYLLQLRTSKRQDQETINKMVKDLQTLSEFIGATESPADWAQAHIYVAMGDYLLLTANHLIGMSNTGQDTRAGMLTPLTAKAYFEAARDQYAYAYGIAAITKENASLGLKREQSNALNGYVQAEQGVILSLDLFNPKGDLNMVREVRGRTLKTLQELYENGIVSTPGANVVSFDPSVHKSIRLVYGMLSDNLNQTIKEWCSDHRDLIYTQSLSDDEERLVKGVESLLEMRRQYLEFAASHAVIQKVLDPGAEKYDKEVQLVDKAYRVDLKSFCSQLAI